MAQRQCLAIILACVVFNITKVNASAWLPVPGETVLLVNQLIATPETHQHFQSYKTKFDKYNNLYLDLQKLYQQTIDRYYYNLGRETGYLDEQVYHKDIAEELKTIEDSVTSLISRRDKYDISSLDALTSIYLEQGITPRLSLGFKLDYAAHSSSWNYSKILSHSLINKIQLSKDDKTVWSFEQQVRFQHSHPYFIHDIECSILRGSNNQISKIPSFTDLKLGVSKGFDADDYLNLEITQGLKFSKNWLLMFQSRNTLFLNQNFTRRFTKLSQQYSLAYTFYPSVHCSEFTVQVSFIVDHFNFANKPSFSHASFVGAIWLKIP